MSIAFIKKLFSIKQPIEYEGTANFIADINSPKDYILIGNSPFNDGVFIGWEIQDDIITITVEGALNRTTLFRYNMYQDVVNVRLSWKQNMCLYIDDKLIEIK